MARVVIRFPDRHDRGAPGKPAAGSDWKLILIDRQDGITFDVSAWTARPSMLGAQRLGLGFADTLVEAAEIARRKATELGVSEIHDLSSVQPPSPETAA